MKLFNRFKAPKTKDQTTDDTEKIAKKFSFKDLINGNILTKEFVQNQLPFILFLAIIALFYINNRFAYEAQLKEQAHLKNELIDAKYRSLTVSEQLTQMSKRSAVIEQLKASGSELQETIHPPIIISK